MKTIYSKLKISFVGVFFLLLIITSPKVFAAAGSTCATAVVVSQASLPYASGARTTCGVGNDYGVGAGGACNTNYGAGEDFVYQLTVTTVPSTYTFTHISSVSWSILQLYSACPSPAGAPTNCLAYSTLSSAGTTTLNYTFTTAGTYYAVLDHWPTPNCGGFQLNISAVTATPCSGMPTAGSATASPTAVCSGGSTNLSVTGATTDSGLTYQWQSSPNNSTWTNIGGATSANYTATPGANTYYRRIITCGGNSANSASVLVTVGSPANDECANATLLPINSDFNCGTVTAGTINCATASAQANACFGTDDDDVWYRFVATSTIHRVSLLNVAGSTTDMYHAVYSGACGSLGTALVCSDADESTLTGLTIGATYRVRVYSWTSTTGQNTTFNICIGSPVSCTIAANQVVDMSDYGNCTITNCAATVTFRDPQGNSNYNPSQDVTHVFTNGAGTPLQAVFNVFDTESCCDELYIYDGPSTASPQVAGSPFRGNALPPTIISSGASLTFRFTPDGSTNGAGFRALINCLPACSGTPTGGTAVASQSVICSASNIDLTITGGTIASSLTYQWQSSTDNATWANITGKTSTNATINVTASTYYRRVTTCTVGGASANSSSVLVTMNSNACNLTYATTTPAVSYDTWTLTNAITFGDDKLSDAKIPFGFDFCFDGRKYTDAYLSSNFAIVFDAVCGIANVTSGVAAPSGSNGYTISGNMPSTTQSMPRNAIMLWQDVAPHLGGSVTYQTLGTAPNRRFVVSFKDVPMYSCTSLLFNGQIKIYETTNTIELHIKDKVVCATFNDGNAAMGLQNYDGTKAIVPTGYNGLDADWTVSGKAWRFTTACSCIIPLAVELNAFEAKPLQLKNEITWTTFSEKDNSYFIVQKSNDGILFQDFETVKSKGNNGAEYLIYDLNPYLNETYYKLQTIDKDGVKGESELRVVKTKNTNSFTNFTIHPNPANDNITINFISETNAEANLQITDLTGRIIVSKTIKLDEGNNSLSQKIDEFENGIYFLKLSTNNYQLFNGKFIKQ